MIEHLKGSFGFLFYFLLNVLFDTHQITIINFKNRLKIKFE
ncbi:hypothetical protein VCRA2121O391_210028 [Vibrio crassostreae]|nr:hypothetical protein VCRA2118O236_110051 [Vibrio crassostreae]CAK1718101.1 hypothetical protein VCRA2114O422_110088 [Vibrio crassostreae]CAK1727624.1 hypothetical protein VCRA2113O220_120050 [Vibrio crassostreae]CAK1727911.1 hypothetical protein VCRA2110O180_120050 [Vibrio crassostreae]CAK1728290.1 hypothetical protein VCRA2113O198_120049 [Vibrio crassostreae]